MDQSSSRTGDCSVITDRRRFLLIDKAGEATHDFGEWPDRQMYWVRGEEGVLLGTSNPFAPVSLAVLGSSPDRLLVSAADTWEIRAYGRSGELNRITRAAIARKPITSDMVAVALDSLLRRSGPSEADRRPFREAFKNLPIPDSLPAIGALYRDAAGNLWSGHRAGMLQSPDEFEVFDPEGRWLTSVRLPSDIRRILEIDDGYLLAPWHDELGVTYVRLYAIRK